MNARDERAPQTIVANDAELLQEIVDGSFVLARLDDVMSPDDSQSIPL